MSVDDPIDVLAEPCPTAPVRTRLSLALIEQLDQARGHLPRSAYLTLVIDVAMTRPEPHLPETGANTDWLDAAAKRRHRQHVRSIELARKEGSN